MPLPLVPFLPQHCSDCAGFGCRIFQFANFKLTKKRVLQHSEEELEGAMVSCPLDIYVRPSVVE